MVPTGASTEDLFTARTDRDGAENGDSYVAVTKVDGGAVGTVAGSGKMVIDTDAVEAGDDTADLTLTYTAYTDITDVDIVIAPRGILTEDPDDDAKELHEGTSKTDSSYGAVYGETSHTTDSKGTLDVNMLPWCYQLGRCES